MFQDKTVTAVILGAGNSSRMGLNINKIYISTDKGAIVKYSLMAFLKHKYIDDIVMVVRPKDKALLEKIIEETAADKPVRIVHGGETRCDSVYLALCDLTSEIAIIHDGARPLLRQIYITECIEAMTDYYGSIIALKNQDVIVRTNDHATIHSIPEQGLYLAQTPQCFHTKVLKQCHEELVDKYQVTDDSSLLEAAGYPVKLINGDKSNIKITTPQDLTMAISYLEFWDS